MHETGVVEKSALHPPIWLSLFEKMGSCPGRLCHVTIYLSIHPNRTWQLWDGLSLWNAKILFKALTNV